MAAASADGDVECDSDIKGDFEHLDSDGFKGTGGAVSTTTVAFRILKRFMARHEKLSSLKPVPVCAPLLSYSRMIPQRAMWRRTWPTIV